MWESGRLVQLHSHMTRSYDQQLLVRKWFPSSVESPLSFAERTFVWWMQGDNQVQALQSIKLT